MSDNIVASDLLLRVGKKGEIYTSKEIRKKVGLKVDGRVRVTAEKGKLIIEPFPSLEEILINPVIKINPEKAEEISEREQKRAGAYG